METDGSFDVGNSSDFGEGALQNLFHIGSRLGAAGLLGTLMEVVGLLEVVKISAHSVEEVGAILERSIEGVVEALEISVAEETLKAPAIVCKGSESSLMNHLAS